MAKSQVSMTVNGKTHRSAGRAAHAAHPLPARAAEHHRPAYRLRNQPLRRLHRRSRRQVGEVLHRVRGAGERRRHPHHRGHGQRRRHAACPAGRLPRDARAAMRLLHAGHDRARLSAAAGEPEPLARRKSASAFPAISAAAPAIRTSSRPFNSPPRSSTACRSRRPQNERHDPHLRRTRRKARRHGLQAQARRGYPLRPGQGQLRRRSEAARHALRRLHPLAARATPASRRSIRPRPRRCPACVAVLTAETLKTVNLAWMPTLAGDVQMVLADGKVLLPEPGSRLRHRRGPLCRGRCRRSGRSRIRGAAGQRRSAQGDGAGRAGDPRGSSRTRPTAPTASASTTTTSSPGRSGDKAATDAAFDKAEVTIKEMIVYPRVHPCPLETCQCVASFDKIKGELTLWGTFQAPHVIRTVGSLISKIPEHKIHVIAPGYRRRLRQQGRRLSGLYLLDRRFDRDRPAGEMGRGPHREPLHHRVRARLLHGDRDRRDQGRQGHGAALSTPSPTTARSTPAPTPPNGRRACSASSPARTISRPRMCWSTASIPTRRRAASPIAARSASPKRPTASSAPWTSWRRSSAWTRPNSA